MSIEWNERNAAHLLRRAAFGGKPEEIARAVEVGLEKTVDDLLDTSIPDGALEARLASARFDLEHPVGIIQWWVTRMIHSRHQLRERMTFFLHDHFATSLIKVNRPPLLLAQNELFRRMAFGNFTDLTIEVSKDPAMLLWLDNYTNRKEHPNENYARELLELFTLGHDVYTEDDVLAAARAFTGWSLERNTLRFRFYPFLHDYGQKTFLGVTGDLDGDDIVRIACAREEHAHFIAAKIFSWFVYEDPEHHTVEKFAAIYRDGGTELAPLLRAILTSEEMFSDRARWAKTKSPVEHAVIGARLLEIDDDVSRPAISIMDRQNQIPFVPQAVDGWPSGLTWINSNTLLARMSLGAYYGALSQMSLPNEDEPVDALLERFGIEQVSAESRAELEKFWASLPGASDQSKRNALVQMVMALPEWQLN